MKPSSFEVKNTSLSAHCFWNVPYRVPLVLFSVIVILIKFVVSMFGCQIILILLFSTWAIWNGYLRIPFFVSSSILDFQSFGIDAYSTMILSLFHLSFMPVIFF